MEINTFCVQKLNGFINIDLDFNSDLTIIIGPNGSGKTSALNLIGAILKLDFGAINKAIFETLQLKLTDQAIGRIEVNIDKSSKESSITIKINDRSCTTNLSDPTISRIIENTMGVSRFILSLQKKFWTHDAGHNEEIQEHQWNEFTDIISNNTKLTFVRLDRTIIATDSEGTETVDTPVKSSPTKTQTKKSTDPIDEVNRVTTERYVEYRRKVDNIKSQALDQLLRLHFEPITAPPVRAKTSESQLKQKLSQLRKRVDTSSLFTDTPNLKTATNEFFDSFEKLLFQDKDSPKKRIGRRTLQEESAGMLVSLKEQQLEALLQVFEREQEQTQNAYLPIKSYLAATSKFLEESGKQLCFNNNLQLAFTIDAHGPEQDPRSLKELSSGERQVIIVLTYLAFLAGDKSIFIIDEPELSLHLRWQAYLVEALKFLRPDSCQIILATHAPEIAGRSRQKVKRLPAQGKTKE